MNKKSKRRSHHRAFPGAVLSLFCLISFLAHWMSTPSTFSTERIMSDSPVRCPEVVPVAQQTEPPKLDDDGDVCAGYDGVLRIRRGDEGAAAGTVFFVYMVNYLIYAEMYNLLPWVHLDGTSERVYDPEIHESGSPVKFRMITGTIKNGEREIPRGPKPPSRKAKKKMHGITGNGVWESYFEPLSEFSPRRNRTCSSSKPLYEMDMEGLAGGMHLEAHWAVRAWIYGDIEKKDRQQSIRDWYRPMRQRAASIVRRYIRPKPWLLSAVEQVNPLEEGQHCIAMHVRTTDKELSGGRSVISLEEYLPKVQELMKKFGETSIIFLATDSAETLKTIKRKWPSEVVTQVRSQASAVRSKSSDPVFDLASHHRTNTEVLTDIYSMAKCSVLIHGRSAVSESVLYINPDIRERSIDVEDDEQFVEDLGFWD